MPISSQYASPSGCNRDQGRGSHKGEVVGKAGCSIQGRAETGLFCWTGSRVTTNIELREATKARRPLISLKPSPHNQSCRPTITLAVPVQGLAEVSATRAYYLNKPCHTEGDSSPIEDKGKHGKGA